MKRNLFDDCGNSSNSFQRGKRTLFEASEEQKNEEPKADATKNAQNVYDKYSGMQKNELVSELMKEVEKSKKNGTFDANILQQSISSIAPMLPKEQIKMMQDMLEKIK